MISYSRLWETMEKKSITKYYLIHYCQVSSGQLNRLKHNRYVSTHTIEMLCRLLSCRIEDIMEYQPDFLPADDALSVPEAANYKPRKKAASSRKKAPSPGKKERTPPEASL